VAIGVAAMPGAMADAEVEEFDTGFRECASRIHPPRKLNVLVSMINVRKLALKNLIRNLAISISD
jgi:hypothetical protein